ACEDCGREWESVCLEVVVNYFIDDLVCKRDLPWQPLIVSIFKPKGAIGVPRSGQLSRTATLSCVVPPWKTNYTWQVNHSGKGLRAGSGCQIIPVTPNDGQSPVMQDKATGDKASSNTGILHQLIQPVHTTSPVKASVQVNPSLFVPGNKDPWTAHVDRTNVSTTNYYQRKKYLRPLSEDVIEKDTHSSTSSMILKVPFDISQKTTDITPKRIKAVPIQPIVKVPQKQSSITSTSEIRYTPSKQQNSKTTICQNLDNQAVEKIVVVPDICVRSDLFEAKRPEASNTSDINNLNKTSLEVKEEQSNIVVTTGIVTEEDEDNESLMSDDIVILEDEPSPEYDIITLDDPDQERNPIISDDSDKERIPERLSPESNTFPKTNERASVLHFAKQSTLHNLPTSIQPSSDSKAKYPTIVNIGGVPQSRDLTNLHPMKRVHLQSTTPANPSIRDTTAKPKDNSCYNIAQFRNIVKHKVAEHYMQACSTSGLMAQNISTVGKKRTIKDVTDSDDHPSKKHCETAVNQLIVNTSPGEFGDPIEDGRILDAMEAVQSGTTLSTAARYSDLLFCVYE
ncbi:unnamed protein product, partial [Meganyctiphanes norvegica]